MTTKELIRAEIERRIEAIANAPSDNGVMDSINGAKGHELMTLLSFLDTLPDESITTCNELEEAAEKSARQYYVDGGYSPFPNTETAAHKSGFIAGAEWQKVNILKDNPVIMPVEDFQALIDSHAKRVEIDYKEKMLKEAVEGFIFQSEDYYPKELIARYNGKLKHGDKVKIIIVKEEE